MCETNFSRPMNLYCMSNEQHSEYFVKHEITKYFQVIRESQVVYGTFISALSVIKLRSMLVSTFSIIGSISVTSRCTMIVKIQCVL